MVKVECPVCRNKVFKTEKGFINHFLKTHWYQDIKANYSPNPICSRPSRIAELVLTHVRREGNIYYDKRGYGKTIPEDWFIFNRRGNGFLDITLKITDIVAYAKKYNLVNINSDPEYEESKKKQEIDVLLGKKSPKKIYDFLKDNKQYYFTSKNIGKEIGLSQSTVSKWLSDLVRLDLIITFGGRMIRYGVCYIYYQYKKEKVSNNVKTK